MRIALHEAGHVLAHFYDRQKYDRNSPLSIQVTIEPGNGFAGRTTYYDNDEIDGDLEFYEYWINRKPSEVHTASVERRCAARREARIVKHEGTPEQAKLRDAQDAFKVDRELFALMAGYASEKLFSPIGRDPREKSSDMRKALALARTICASDHSAYLRVEWAFAEAKATLQSYRLAILHLAEILIERRTMLDGQEIYEIITTAISGDRRAEIEAAYVSRLRAAFEATETNQGN
jgi:hypothetical protein